MTYSYLINAINERNKNVAKFFTVVLHNHSTQSCDYNKDLYGNPTPTVTEKVYQESILKSGISLIAVTDHMRCEFACRLSTLAFSQGKCILPGMEVNVRPQAPWNNFRVHSLAIFPECTSLAKIEKIFPPKFKEEISRSTEDEISDVTLIDFVKNVHNCEGLCIAAHIDSDRGLRQCFRQLGEDGIVLCEADKQLTLEEQQSISANFKEWLLFAGFDAIEVSKTEHKTHYRWRSEVGDNLQSVPVMLKNDSHCLTDLDKSEWHTHIKMTKPCYEDLRLAFKFPDTRIRFPNEIPPSPSPRIIGLEIVSGDDKGFFKNIQLAFSDNLSCMIGARGSGKSAIIESLRYALGKNRELKLSLANTDLETKSRDLQKTTLQNCMIRVIYARKDGQINILESAFDPKQDYSTKVYLLDGTALNIADLESSGMFPLRLFGWSEIETLGRAAVRQRELLDRLIPEFTPLMDERDRLRATLSKNKKEIQSKLDSLMEIVNTNNGEIKLYKACQTEFDKLNTPEIDKLFADIDSAKEKLVILEKIKGKITDWKNELNTDSEYDVFANIEDFLLTISETNRDWWVKNPIQTKIVTIAGEVKQLIVAAIGQTTSLEGEINLIIKQIEDEIKIKETEIKNTIGQEVTKQVAAELRKSAKERLESVNKLKRQYNETLKSLKLALLEWRTTCTSLVQAQNDISQVREKQKEQIEAKLNKFSTPDMKISLRLTAGGHRVEFIEFLTIKGILNKKNAGNYISNRIPLKISLLCNPVELSFALLDNNIQALAERTDLPEGVALGEEAANLLLSSYTVFSPDDDADVEMVDKEKLNAILSIAEVTWDDDERILLNDNPVDEKSPGQRSSAMLPLIALAENAPLIIDQPEDNLDNKLVGKMLVDVLASLKEYRQIIVATHNPNIVVSGDAEQVIVLDALSDHEGTLVHAGSIDKDYIVKSVIEIMEGGKEAFRNRKRRYNI